MASRPGFKQGNSFGPSGDAYEMQSYAGYGAVSGSQGKNGDAMVITEESENKYKGATANDRHDMNRLGKTQELRVRRTASDRNNWSTANPTRLL